MHPQHYRSMPVNHVHPLHLQDFIEPAHVSSHKQMNQQRSKKLQAHLSSSHDNSRNTSRQPVHVHHLRKHAVYSRVTRSPVQQLAPPGALLPPHHAHRQPLGHHSNTTPQRLTSCLQHGAKVLLCALQPGTAGATKPCRA